MTEWIIVRPDEAYNPGRYRVTFNITSAFTDRSAASARGLFLSGLGKVKPASITISPPNKNLRLGRNNPWTISGEFAKSDYAPEDKVVDRGTKNGPISHLNASMTFGDRVNVTVSGMAIQADPATVAEAAQQVDHNAAEKVYDVTKNTIKEVGRNAAPVFAGAVKAVENGAAAVGSAARDFGMGIGDVAGNLTSKVASPLTLPLMFIAIGLVALVFLREGK